MGVECRSRTTCVAGGCLSFLFQLPTKIFLVIIIFLFSVIFVVISTFLVCVAVV